MSESERIEEQFEDLIRGLDLDAPLTFHVGLDVKAAHTWKAPYRDIEVCPMRPMRHALAVCIAGGLCRCCPDWDAALPVAEVRPHVVVLHKPLSCVNVSG